ncbi:MAG: glutamate-5-semialdehyde dehydrogenase [Kiritimatiellaeota bacterium]|nr:glutamate-5-semialdehyde dehydrogenase [Kiritimatiellota bacterium]
MESEILKMAGDARAASRAMAALSTAKKNRALLAIADALETARPAIMDANARDLEAGRAAGLSSVLLDRLTLTDSRFNAMAAGVRQVAALPDPLGRRVGKKQKPPNGLAIEKRRAPIGVIAIIYESRPNVTVDAAVLCVKTSNAVILRGGKEAVHSNRAIAEAMIAGGEAAGLPRHAIQLVRTLDRAAVGELVGLDGLVDLVIPRGGESLIRAVAEQARVPVLKHYKGVCHIFVDKDADLERALPLVENAKCQRPGVCNAVETLLVHQGVAAAFLPMLAGLAQRRGIQVHACEQARKIVPEFAVATEDDWFAEYLDLVLAVRVVPGVDAAIEHINHYGSHHSDAILTASAADARRFLKSVDSAAVYVNASTRFTDGAEFGLGAEMGISTDKFHARGPVGLEELTTYKWLARGDYTTRK